MLSASASIKGFLAGALGSATGNRMASGALARVSHGFQILIYHRVLRGPDSLAIAPVGAREFAAQMKLLRDCYHVVSLDRLLADLEADQLKPGTVCVTFDDGYRDNLELALPILREYGIPATIFLATDVITGGGALWYDRVLQAFRDTRRPELHWPEAGMDKEDIGDLQRNPRPAYRALEWLKTFPPDIREAKMKDLFSALALDGEPRCSLMLDWDQVRAMQKQGVDFGAHTQSHPILSTIGPAAMEAEIAGSKRIIETQTGKPVRHFAYPNGKAGDYGEAAKAILKKCGFACALTTNPGLNRIGQDRFELLRSQPWEKSIHRFHGRLVLERFLS